MKSRKIVPYGELRRRAIITEIVWIVTRHIHDNHLKKAEARIYTQVLSEYSTEKLLCLLAAERRNEKAAR